MKNKIHPISSYLFSLSIICFAAIVVCFAYPCYALRMDNDVYKLYIFCGFLFAVYFITCYVNAFWYFGMYKLAKNKISFYAPFRKPIHMQFERIQFIGIDISEQKDQQAFWIYFSEKPIPPKYLRKINKMPASRSCMRISYSEKRFQELMDILPHKQAKELSKGVSMLHVYGKSSSSR